jgi:hypothetical protein
MGMNAVYVADELFDRVSHHLTATPVMFIHSNGVLSKIEQEAGLWIQFGADLHCRIANEDELRLACKMVVAYHDSLRTESELLEIEDAEQDRLDSALLEEAAIAHEEACEKDVEEPRDDGFV